MLLSRLRSLSARRVKEPRRKQAKDKHFALEGAHSDEINSLWRRRKRVTSVVTVRSRAQHLGFIQPASQRTHAPRAPEKRVSSGTQGAQLLHSSLFGASVLEPNLLERVGWVRGRWSDEGLPKQVSCPSNQPHPSQFPQEHPKNGRMEEKAGPILRKPIELGEKMRRIPS